MFFLILSCSIVYLFTINEICILYNTNLLCSNFTDNTDSKSRSREWLTEYQSLRNSKLQSGFADFIFEEVTQRLDDFFEIYEIRKAAYIVMGFDHCGFSAETALYNVWINGSLCQEIYGSDFLCFFFKNADKFFTDDLTFCFRLCYTGKFIIVSLLRIDTDEIQIELSIWSEYAFHFITFVFAEKTMIYTHSSVPAENQLMLPFLSLVSEAELARNPTVKAEMEASGHELTGLLLTYPVHQACDILFCKGNVVPVGRDQLPHIELTRTIARRFNNRYGKVFPEVDALLSETPLLPGLDGRKMSKSYGNAINISMTAEETAKRIKKSQTDSERMITFDPENRPGVSGLLSTAAICTGRSEVEIAEEIGMGGSGQLKKYVTEAVNEYFAPIRERRQRYENDLDYVKDVLHEGNRRANEIAEQTLAEVRDAMGMVY